MLADDHAKASKQNAIFLSVSDFPHRACSSEMSVVSSARPMIHGHTCHRLVLCTYSDGDSWRKA